MSAHKRCKDGKVVLQLFALLSTRHLVFAVANTAHKRFFSSTHDVWRFEGLRVD